MKILQFPLTKITVAFIFGLLFFQKYQPAIAFIFGSLCLLLLLSLGFHFWAQKNKHCKIAFGILTLCTSFSIGIATAVFHKENIRPNHFTHLIQNDSLYTIQLSIHEKLKPTAKNHRFVADIIKIDRQNSSGKIILNIRKSGRSETIPIGTELTVYSTIYPNQNPFNPNQFDYGKYLENQEIYGQVYAQDSQIKIGQTHSGLWANFSNFRTKIIQNLELSGCKKEELTIIVALLLGQQQDIAPEILKDYQWAGAVHILSVSGLHVGFILLFVSFFLKPISNTKRNVFIKLIIILLSLWGFGLLAGLAPSVVRSVTMFSFVAIGNQLRRTVNSFHTLLVSMLLILLWKPSFLFDVGFQLSYLALFFILWLQPLLSDIWQPQNKILSYFRDILTVSFAAQIGTFPLSIYYFHQFPGLFFVTNLVLLPLLGIIMVIGLLAVAIACFGKVPSLIVKLMEVLIEFQNGFIHWVASLESFVFKDISFTPMMLWFSYAVIIAVILWLKKPDFGRLTIALLSIIALQLVFINMKRETNYGKELIVFNTKKNTIITERYANKVTVLSNDSLLKTAESNPSVQSYLVGNFCEIKEKKPLGNVLFFKDKKIFLIDSTALFLGEIKPDVMIISNSPKLNMERLLKECKPSQIVADGSNYKSYVKLWEATCLKAKIPFHYTNEKGFYKL